MATANGNSTDLSQNARIKSFVVNLDSCKNATSFPGAFPSKVGGAGKVAPPTFKGKALGTRLAKTGA